MKKTKTKVETVWLATIGMYAILSLFGLVSIITNISAIADLKKIDLSGNSGWFAENSKGIMGTYLILDTVDKAVSLVLSIILLLMAWFVIQRRLRIWAFVVCGMGKMLFVFVIISFSCAAMERMGRAGVVSVHGMRLNPELVNTAFNVGLFRVALVVPILVLACVWKASTDIYANKEITL